MERCRVMVRHAVIDADDLALDAVSGSPRGDADGLPPDWFDAELPAAVARLERLLICDALSKCHGNRAETARRLGIHRQLLYRKMEQYGIKT